MTDNEIKVMSTVDTTSRIKWEITKEEFENRDKISSPYSVIYINGEKSKWYLTFLKVAEEGNKEKVKIYLMRRRSGGRIYKVRYEFGIKTKDGPDDKLKKFYSRRRFPRVALFGHAADKSDVNDGWGYSLCTSEEFKEYFVDDKVTVVGFFVIYVEGDKHLDHMKVADDFTARMRSMSSYENLSDFTIISENIHFPCHRVILATRSEYFEALFRNEPSKKETQMDESPEAVQTILDFMYKGLIPEDIDEKALDLILMSDKYGLDLLTMACEKSLVINLTTDNAVETLITIDKIKHVSKLEHRKKVLAFIKKEVDDVTKTQDWNKFVQTYPSLFTEILLLK